MTDLISPDLKNGRARLRLVSPLPWAICWIFVLINCIIAPALAFIYNPAVPIVIVGRYFTFEMWALIFLFLGIGNAFNLINNRYRAIKTFLLGGLVVKMFWEFALIIRTFQDPPATIMLTVLWTFFILVQAATFIWFLPSVQIGRDVNNE